MLERTKSDQHCQPISRMQRLTMAKSAVDRRRLRRCPHFPGWLTPSLATKFVFIVCALVLMGRAPGRAEPLELFVSPTGNDSWSGTTADPRGDGRDGPFASLQRACDEIRSRRAESPAEGLSDSVTVFVLGGIHEIMETLVLGPQDSGTGTIRMSGRPRLSTKALRVDWPTKDAVPDSVFATTEPRSIYGRHLRSMQPDDVSRLVARLQRGEYGIFSTTSYYTKATQNEVV